MINDKLIKYDCRRSHMKCNKWSSTKLKIKSDNQRIHQGDINTDSWKTATESGGMEACRRLGATTAAKPSPGHRPGKPLPAAIMLYLQGPAAPFTCPGCQLEITY